MDRRITQIIGGIVKETLDTSWALLKITIPVIIITKILEELGLIIVLSNLLEPLMGVIGLPGELGLVWATALLTNLYGAMIVFATLAPGLNLDIGQATIICSAMLIAHSLPLEMTITKKAGAPFWPIALLRLAGAFIYAFLLNSICRLFGIWQKPALILFTTEKASQSLLQWTLSQLENFILIIMVIFCIIIIMKILRYIGVLSFFERVLEPILPFFGMSKKAAPVTVVGMIMGISYGGALIIQETNSGKMDRREIFFSLALMGLSHSLIEDTLLMVALGGHWGGLLVGRLIFSLLVIYLLVLATKKSDKECRFGVS